MMELDKRVVIAISVVAVLIAIWWFFFKSKTKKSGGGAAAEKPSSSANKEKVTIYGSLGCPYTLKQMDKYPNHEFVDCTTTKCPDFVTAYPTTKMADGRIEIGFS